MANIDVDSIQTFTNAELARIFRRAAVDAAFAQSMSVNGHSLARMSAEKLMSLADAYEAAAARERSGGFSVAQFRDAE